MRLWASEMAVVMEAVGGERARERESEAVFKTWHEARVGDR